MTWMWVGAFGLMFVSAMIPPIVDGDATILDMDDTLSIVCYWVIPYTVLGIAGAISAVFPPWFDKKSAEVDKRNAAPPVVVPQPVSVGEPVSTDDELSIDAPADSRLDEPFTATIIGGQAGSTIEVTTSGTGPVRPPLAVPGGLHRADRRGGRPGDAGTGRRRRPGSGLDGGRW